MSSSIMLADMSQNMEGMDSICQISRTYEVPQVEMALIVSSKRNH